MVGLAKRAVTVAAGAQIPMAERELIAGLKTVVAGLLVEIAQGIPKRDALDGAVLSTLLIIGRIVKHLSGPLSLCRLMILYEQKVASGGAPEIVAHEEWVRVLRSHARGEHHPAFRDVLNTRLRLIASRGARAHIPALTLLRRHLVMGQFKGSGGLACLRRE
jgi:hypothetical protein